MLFRSVSSILIFFFFPFFFPFWVCWGFNLSFQVSSSEVRTKCPSISFLFACLGVSLGVFPHLENFISEGNSLGVVVADLLPLLHQSIDWFRDLVREVMSEVRSSELETGCRQAVNQWRGIPPSLLLARLGLFTPSTRSVVWTTIP